VGGDLIDILLVAVGGVEDQGQLGAGAVVKGVAVDAAAHLQVPGCLLGQFPVVEELQFVGEEVGGGLDAGEAFTGEGGFVL
jgi:hypothetical protein